MTESGCLTFRSWQGVCPKLLMMPSRAFRSVSLAIASKSTAPAGQQAARLRNAGKNAGTQEKEPFDFFLTLVSAIVEHIESFHSFLSSLFVTKDQIDPLVQVTGDVLGFLGVDVGLGSRQVQENLRNWQACRLTRAFICFLMKSSLDVAHRGSRTSATWSCDICRRPRSKPNQNDGAATRQPL